MSVVFATTWLLLAGVSGDVSSHDAAQAAGSPIVRASCITPEEYARAKRGETPEAFQESSIPLGPIFWATRDRTLVQAMLVYWRYLGVDSGTRLELVLPIYARHCAKDAETIVGPLGSFGWRSDDAGTAGYFGPYLFRRDLRASSDVLFPVFWWLRDDTRHTLIAGPWFDLASRETTNDPWTRRFGLAPVYFAGRDPDGSYFDISPLFASWGDPHGRTTWFAQTYLEDRGEGGWSATSIPFYTGATHADGRYHHIVPPLAFAIWGDVDSAGDTREGLVAGPYFSVAGPEGSVGGIAPFFAGGVEDGTARGPLQAGVGRLRGGPLAAAVPPGGAPFSWWIIPPLVAGGWQTDDTTTTSALLSFYRDSPRGYDLGISPLYFRGRSADGERGYDVAPLALFGHWKDGDGETTWVGQTIARRDARGTSFDSPPFWFEGDRSLDDGTMTRWLVVPPLGYAHWRRGDSDRRVLLGGWFFESAHGYDLGVPPVYFAGQTRDSQFRYSLIPPLLFADVGFKTGEALIAGPWFDLRFRGARGEQRYFGVAPLAIAADGPRAQFVATPLAAWWRDEAVEHLWALQTLASWHEGAWRVDSFPLFHGGRTEEGAFSVLVPPALLFAWDEPEAPAGARHGIVAGPFWSVVEPAGQDTGVLGLWAAGERVREGRVPPLSRLVDALVEDTALAPLTRERGHWRLVPPLAYAHAGDGELEATWWLSGWWVRSPRGYDLGAAPLFFHGRSEEGRFYDVVPLLSFARWGDDARSTTVAGPWIDIRRDGAWDVGLLPLFAAGAGPEEEPTRDSVVVETARDSLVPFLGEAAARRAVPPGLRYLIIPPLLLGAWGVGDVSTGYALQSYWSFSPDGTTIASAPFFWFDEKTTVTGDVTGDVTADATAPSGDAPARTGAERTVVEQTVVVPPLLTYWQKTQTSELLIAGLWIERRDERGSNLIVPPLWLAGHARPGQRSPLLDAIARAGVTGSLGAQLPQTGFSYRLAPPLLYASAKSADMEGHLLGPSWFLRSEHGVDVGVAPLFVHGHNRVGGYDVVPPALFGWWRDGDEHNVWWAQSLLRLRERAWSLWSAPFYFGGQGMTVAGAAEEDAWYHVVPPGLFAAWGTTDVVDVVALQTWTHFAPERWLALSVPFYFGTAERGRDDKNAFVHVVPPALTAVWGDGADSLDVWAAQTFVRSRAHGWSVASVPFYLGGEGLHLDGSHAPGAFHHVFPLLLSGTWGDSTRRFDVIGGPLYLHWDTPAERATWAGLYYQRVDKRTGDQAHALAPFWFSGRDSAAYWDVVLPIYANWGDYDEERSFFAPTLTYRSRVDDEDLLLAPLVYHRADEASHDTVVFPVWWDFERPGLDVTVAGGLWWDFGFTDESKRLQIAPGFVHWEDPDEHLYIAGPVSWSDAKKTEAWSFHLWPMLSMWSHHKDHFKWRALLVALGHEREGDVEQWTVLGVKTERKRRGGGTERSQERSQGEGDVDRQ